MYDVDGLDTVIELPELPPCDPGAPMPALAAADGYLKVGYISLASEQADELIVVVTFHRPYAHLFGPPNDEAFLGHPLSDRGKTPNSIFRLQGPRVGRRGDGEQAKDATTLRSIEPGSRWNSVGGG